MTTIKDLIRDDVIGFLDGYDSDESASLGNVKKDAEVLVDEIVETINEQIGKFLGT